MAWSLSVMCGIPCQCLWWLSHRDKDKKKKNTLSHAHTHAPLTHTLRWTLHNTLCQRGLCLWNVKWPPSSHGHVSSPIDTHIHRHTTSQLTLSPGLLPSCNPAWSLIRHTHTHTQSEALHPAECLSACHPPDRVQQPVTNITPWLAYRSDCLKNPILYRPAKEALGNIRSISALLSSPPGVVVGFGGVGGVWLSPYRNIHL